MRAHIVAGQRKLAAELDLFDFHSSISLQSLLMLFFKTIHGAVVEGAAIGLGRPCKII